MTPPAGTGPRSGQAGPVRPPAAPIGYYWGDDTWSVEHAAEGLLERIAGPGGERLQRWRVTGATTTPAQVGERVATGALFGGGTAAIVTDPGPLIRAKANREELIGLLATVAPGNALVFLDPVDRWPRDGRLAGDRATLAAAVEAAGGEVRGSHAPTEGGMARWIEDRAGERGLRLAPGAARTLAERVGAFVREADVDRRRQGQLAVAELDKLALYRPDGPITSDDVRELSAEAAPASAWALLDAVGFRRTREAVGLLDRVLEATAEPVVVVQLHRRLRELIEIGDLVASGTPPPDLPRLLKLHPHRAQTLARQAAAWTIEELIHALEGLMELDALVKGAGRSTGRAPAVRLAFTLWLAERVAPAVD